MVSAVRIPCGPHLPTPPAIPTVEYSVAPGEGLSGAGTVTMVVQQGAPDRPEHGYRRHIVAHTMTRAEALALARALAEACKLPEEPTRYERHRAIALQPAPQRGCSTCVHASRPADLEPCTACADHDERNGTSNYPEWSPAC